jgi:hypothetical protein
MLELIQTIAASLTLFAALTLSIGLLGRMLKFYIEGTKTGKSEVSAEFMYATAFLWALFYFLTNL